MRELQLESYAKINLCLDVKGLLDNGFHQVEMIMQQILLSDVLSYKWEESAEGDFNIELTTNRGFLPNDERNLAYKAAVIMHDRFASDRKGTLKIDIRKRIPVAAGLAGGSGNGASVIHALNLIWDLGLDVGQMCQVSTALGSDVPFCLMGQAAEDSTLKPLYKDDPLACHCALATGTGTELKPLKGLKSDLVLSKPSISVSTAEVYKGIDELEIVKHPDTEEMIRALEACDRALIEKNLVNVLENYTLIKYPIVVYTKNKLVNECELSGVLMSGSGPSVFGLCESRQQAMEACERLKADNRETFWTRTTWEE